MPSDDAPGIPKTCPKWCPRHAPDMPQMMPQTCPRFTSFRFIHKQVRSKVVPLGLPLCALKVRMGPPGPGGQICLQLTPNYTVSWFSRNQVSETRNHLLPSCYFNILLLAMLFVFGKGHLGRPWPIWMSCGCSYQITKINHMITDVGWVVLLIPNPLAFGEPD